MAFLSRLADPSDIFTQSVAVCEIATFILTPRINRSPPDVDASLGCPIARYAAFRGPSQSAIFRVSINVTAVENLRLEFSFFYAIYKSQIISWNWITFLVNFYYTWISRRFFNLQRCNFDILYLEAKELKFILFAHVFSLDQAKSLTPFFTDWAMSSILTNLGNHYGVEWVVSERESVFKLFFGNIHYITRK